MIERRNLNRLSKILPRLYVIAFLAGGYSGFTGVLAWNNGWFSLGDPHILRTLAFPAYGILFGMLWLGLGPVVALFFSGLKDGAALKSYLLAGGSIYFGEAYVMGGKGAQLLGIGVGLVESMSLLYASTGGMYLAMHLIERYRYGMGAGEVQKINFTRKVAIGLFLAAIAVGLRLTLYGGI